MYYTAGQICIVACLLSIILSSAEGARLTVCSGSNPKKLCFNGKQVYLSGMNQAWSSEQLYAKDFGNYYYNLHSKTILEKVLSDIRAAGGNSIRIFVHTDSQFTPAFNNDGTVGAADHSCNHIIREMKDYLCAAQRYNIYVFFVLWNGAYVDPNLHAAHQLNGLINDVDKLESYINNALIPIVNGLKTYEWLGGYDIINEPEGIVITGAHDNAHPHICHRGNNLHGTGAGWATTGPHEFWMYRLQRFINYQASAIKTADPASLVTVGSWRENPQYNAGATNVFNFYTNFCLYLAGGKSNGFLDFYQMHTYKDDNTNMYSPTSPMVKPASFYNLNKPLIIGEFSVEGGVGTIQNLVTHAYYGGYAGAWSWHAAGIGHNSDSFMTQAAGLQHIRHKKYVQFSAPSIRIGCPRINQPFNERLRRCPLPPVRPTRRTSPGGRRTSPGGRRTSPGGRRTSSGGRRTSSGGHRSSPVGRPTDRRNIRIP